MSEFVWDKVDVYYCEEWDCWTIGGYDAEGNREYLGDAHYKQDAVIDAQEYAFCTACGSQRGRAVEVYTRKGDLQKVVYATA